MRSVCSFIWFVHSFEELVDSYNAVKENLQVSGKYMTSKANRRSFYIGHFYTPTLGQLRSRVQSECKHLKGAGSSLTVNFVHGDVSELHANEKYKHATFQAASQFNCLEFVDPHMLPEHGITVYEYDRTQGPACSIACGPATAYRNYFHNWKNREGRDMVKKSLGTA